MTTTSSKRNVSQHSGWQGAGTVPQHKHPKDYRPRAWRAWIVALAMVLADILLALLVWLGAYILQSKWGGGVLSPFATTAVVPSVAVWIGLRWVMGLYPGYGLSSAERLRRHTYSVFATLAIISVFAVAVQMGGFLSRSLLTGGFAGLLFVAPLVQNLVRSSLKRWDFWGRSVVVIGYKDTSAQIVKLLEEEWGLGYNPVAVFDRGLVPRSSLHDDSSQEEAMTEAEDIARRSGLNTIVFAMPYTRREQLAGLVDRASCSFQHVIIIPNLTEITNSATAALDLAGTFAVEIKHNLLNPWALRTKRTLDLFGAVIGGLMISWIIGMIALMVKLTSPGPVFYGHLRLGAGGAYFRCWKFRTMHTQAERLLEEHLRSNPNLRAEWEQNQKLRDDPRVTTIGHVLRKSSLDELPQLWNVLRGQMSLIGPRPIVDAEVPKYGDVYELYKRITSGISGFWQVSGRSNTSYPERVAMDFYYVRNWSVWLDLIILARTVKIVVLRRGAR
jgi:Undecaprenyl-phosphate galactose phosphotransferase WbaP